jgi:hypothetical protein
MADPTYIAGGVLTEPGAMVCLAEQETTNATTTNFVFTPTAADVNDWSQYQDLMWIYWGSGTTSPGSGGSSSAGTLMYLQMNNATGNDYAYRYTRCNDNAQSATGSEMVAYTSAPVASNISGNNSHLAQTDQVRAMCYGYIPNPYSGNTKLATSFFGSAKSSEGASYRSWVGYQAEVLGFENQYVTSGTANLSRVFQPPLTELDFSCSTGYFTESSYMALYGIFHRMNRV